MVKDLRLLFQGVVSSWKGLRLTFGHLLAARRRNRLNDIRNSGYFKSLKGQSTLLYPFETIPVPDHGRYKLHNEIEDCIVCDKCAKICPVDCIDIEPIKSPVEFGKTSDGTSKRIYAAKFDIDMAKCCYCGLCTTVCPTECLTMTPEYDFSVFDLEKLNFGFGNISEEEAQKHRTNWEEAKVQKSQSAGSSGTSPGSGSSPSPRPRMRPAQIPGEEKTETPPQTPSYENLPGNTQSPGFQPRMRPARTPVPEEKTQISGEVASEKPAATESSDPTSDVKVPQPRMRPVRDNLQAPVEGLENTPVSPQGSDAPRSAEPDPSEDPSKKENPVPKPAYQPRQRPVVSKPKETPPPDA